MGCHFNILSFPNSNFMNEVMWQKHRLRSLGFLFSYLVIQNNSTERSADTFVYSMIFFFVKIQQTCKVSRSFTYFKLCHSIMLHNYLVRISYQVILPEEMICIQCIKTSHSISEFFNESKFMIHPRHQNVSSFCKDQI